MILQFVGAVQKCCISEHNKCPSGFRSLPAWDWESSLSSRDPILELFVENSEDFTVTCILSKLNITNLTITGQSSDRAFLWLDIKGSSGGLEQFKLSGITVVLLNRMEPMLREYEADKLFFNHSVLVNPPLRFRAREVTVDAKTAADLCFVAETTKIIQPLENSVISHFTILQYNQKSTNSSITLELSQPVKATLWNTGICLSYANNTHNISISGQMSVNLVHTSDENGVLELDHVFGNTENWLLNRWGMSLFRLTYTCQNHVTLLLKQKNHILHGLRFRTATIDAEYNDTGLILAFLECGSSQCRIGSAKNISVVLESDPLTNMRFDESVRWQISSTFNQQMLTNCTFSELMFPEGKTDMIVTISPRFFGAVWNVSNVIEKGHVNLMPEPASDIDIYNCTSMIGSKIMTICAPNLNCDMYKIQESSSVNHDTPYGFRNDAMSFTTACERVDERKCVSMLFSYDPTEFAREICVYDTNERLCKVEHGAHKVQKDKLFQYLSGLSGSLLEVLDIFFVENIENFEISIPEKLETLLSLSLRSSQPMKATLRMNAGNWESLAVLKFENMTLKLIENNGIDRIKLNLMLLHFGPSSTISNPDMIDMEDVMEVGIYFPDYVRGFRPSWYCQNIVFVQADIKEIHYTDNGWKVLSSTGSSYVVIDDIPDTSFGFMLGNVSSEGISFSKQSNSRVSSLSVEFMEVVEPESCLHFDDTWKDGDIALSIVADSYHVLKMNTSSQYLPVSFEEVPVSTHRDREVIKLTLDIDQDIIVNSPFVLEHGVVEYLSIEGSTQFKMTFPMITLSQSCSIEAHQTKDGVVSWGGYSVDTNSLTVTESVTVNLIGVHVNKEVVFHSNSTTRAIHSNFTGAELTFNCRPDAAPPQLQYLTSIAQMPNLLAPETMLMEEDTYDDKPEKVLIIHPDAKHMKISSLNRTALESSQPVICTKTVESCTEIMSKTQLEPDVVRLSDGSLEISMACKAGDALEGDMCLYLNRKVVPARGGGLPPAALAGVVVCCVLAVTGVISTILFLKWYRRKARTESTIKQVLLDPPADF